MNAQQVMNARALAEEGRIHDAFVCLLEAIAEEFPPLAESTLSPDDVTTANDRPQP
jgi:hypothetical protein